MGVPPLADSHRDKKTYMRRQTFRHPDEQTNKAEASLEI